MRQQNVIGLKSKKMLRELSDEFTTVFRSHAYFFVNVRPAEIHRKLHLTTLNYLQILTAYYMLGKRLSSDWPRGIAPQFPLCNESFRLSQ